MKIGDKVEILDKNSASIEIGDTGRVAVLPTIYNNVYTVEMTSGRRKGVHYVFSLEHMKLITDEWDN